MPQTIMGHFMNEASHEQPAASVLLVPAAQYIRMSTEHQKYSIENQQFAIDGYARMACPRFRRHRVKVFNGAGGGLWNEEDLPESSSLKRCA
jgi:hypothetical protein